MKIAVTGASGFIGSYLMAELAHHKVKTVAVTRDAFRLAGIKSECHSVQMDISRPGKDCFSRLGRPDVLIHLAWDGLPNYKSLHHFETELPRHYCFLKEMIKGGLPSLLVAGTCFEYGMQSGPLSEKLMTRPSNPYGFAKDALRKQLEYLQNIKKFNLTWARLFYIFGEGQSKNSIHSQLRESVLRGDRVFNMSGGEQLRDYLPVKKVARLISILAKNDSNRGCINVCSGEPISIRKLVEGWVLENDWDIELNLGFHPYPDYEPMAFWGNNDRLSAILNGI